MKSWLATGCISLLFLLFSSGIHAQELIQIIDENEASQVRGDKAKNVLAPLSLTDSASADFVIEEQPDPKGNSAGQGLSLMAIPVNNNCVNAIALVVDAPCINGTNKESTMQTGEATACQGTLTKSVWYKFVATSANMFVEVERTASSGCYLSSAVYSGTCLPANANALSCEDAAGGPNLNIHNLTGLTVGATYLVQVGYRGGTLCGNNSNTGTGADFCIKVGNTVTCSTCNNPCGSVCIFPTPPTVAQVTSTCTQYVLKPRLNIGQSKKQCYTFTAVATSFSLQMIINASGCSGGNVTVFNWSLYPANCSSVIQSGTLANLNATGLNIGASYVLCYDWTASCQHNSVYPYIVATSPLPVTLVHFEGDQSGNTVVLNWVTASELNNAYFSVQRSTNGKDFSEVGKVHGQGTTGSIHKYKFIDRKPVNGISYYRLVQFDYDNTSTASEMIAVRFRDAFSVQIGPNPVTETLSMNVSISKETELFFVIMNHQGEQILEHSAILPADTENFTLPVDKLASGSYLIKVSDPAANTFWLRFVKI